MAVQNPADGQRDADAPADQAADGDALEDGDEHQRRVTELPADEAGRDRRGKRRPGRAGGDRHAQHDHHVEPHRQARPERRRREVDDQARAGRRRAPAPAAATACTNRSASRRVRRHRPPVLGTRSSAAVSSVNWTGLLRKSFMPGREALLAVVLERVRGQGDDPRRPAGPRLDPAGRLEAVELRHLDVHEDDVVGLALDGIDGEPAVLDDVRPVAEPLQHARRDALVDRVVLGDEQTQVAGRLLAARRRPAPGATAPTASRQPAAAAPG